MSWAQTFLYWSAADVARWLTANGLGEYSNSFIEEEVNGRSLMGLTPALLAALLPKIGPQAEFNYILNELKHGDNTRREFPSNRGANRPEQPQRLQKRNRKGQSPAVPIEIPEIPNSNESQVSASDDTLEDDISSPLYHQTLQRDPNIASLANQNDSYVSNNQQASTSSPLETTLVGGDVTVTEEQMRFMLSEVPESLMHRLDQPDAVLPFCMQQGRRSEKNQLIRCVYEQLQKLTMYPSALQYRQAGQTIVIRFPHLRDDSKTGFDHWAKTLKERFKNQRRSMTDNPAVMERKQCRQRQFDRTFGDIAGDSPSKMRRLGEPEEMEDVKLFYEPHDALNIQSDCLDIDTEHNDEEVEEKSNQ